MPSVRDVYEQELAARGYQSDPAQLRGVAALERCAVDWSHYKEQRSNAFKKLINRPPILLADEPTGALDSRTGEEILGLFKRLQDDDHTVVLITHDADVAAHCDRIFVMRDGELHEQEAGLAPGHEQRGGA